MKNIREKNNLGSFQLSLPLAMITATLLSLVFVGVMIGITFVGFFWMGWKQITSFTTAAHTTPWALGSQLLAGWQQTPDQTAGRKNILLLGIDKLDTRGDSPVLSDTIILLSLDLKTGKIYAASFPRDLWSETYQQRLNSLYFSGLKSNLSPSDALITSEISKLADVKIHHTLVLTFEDVAQLIDLLGGVEIDVPEAFVDERFPRSDVDVTLEKDPERLYQRVEFFAGVQRMDGKVALQYMRSRHSLGTQGNDIARNVRQQLMISSLLKQCISSRQIYQNPVMLGSIYAFYNQKFAAALSVAELISTVKVFLPSLSHIEFIGGGFPVYPEDRAGVLYHPPESTTRGAWIYRIRNQIDFTRKAQEILHI